MQLPLQESNGSRVKKRLQGPIALRKGPHLDKLAVTANLGREREPLRNVAVGVVKAWRCAAAAWRLSSALHVLSTPTRSAAGRRRLRTELQSLKTAGGLLHRTSQPKRGAAVQELAKRARAKHGLQASASSPRPA
jgi:hypothetical protein